ncbi:CD4-1 molecule [Synchiropus picturatus]
MKHFLCERLEKARCVGLAAPHDKMIFQASVAILVTAIASVIGVEQVIYAQLDGTVALEAQHKKLKFSVQTWFKENTLVARIGFSNRPGTYTDDGWRYAVSEGQLVIRDIKESDFGIFKVIQIQHFEKKNTTETIILCKMSVSLQPSLLLPGDILSLACDANTPAGHKAPEIYWVKPRGTKLDKDAGVSGGRLMVRVTREDHGLWTCVLRNNQREETAVVAVRVLALLTPDSQFTSESSPLTLPCSISPQVSWAELKSKSFQGVYWHFLPAASSESPQRLFSLERSLIWKEDGGRGLHPAQELHRGFYSLRRKRGRADDVGLYECSMVFEGGVTLRRTTRVEVLHITSSPAAGLYVGQVLNLSCSIGRPLPPGMRFEWVSPGMSSLPPLPRHDLPTCVTVPEVAAGDSGRWSCELWQNNTYMTSAEMTLTVETHFTKWKLVIICTTSATIIIIIVICLIYRQKRRRRRRRRYCRCKHPKIRRLMPEQATGS